MQAINRYQLEPLHFPVDGYLFIVKMITSVDGGRGGSIQSGTGGQSGCR